MDMDAYSHFVNHSSLGSTALSAGEAAMQMTSSFNASNQYPAQPTEPTYQPTSIHDIQLMSDQADKQQALLNSQFTNPNAYSVPLSLNARGDGPHPSARGQLSRRQYVPMTAGGTTSSGTHTTSLSNSRLPTIRERHAAPHAHGPRIQESHDRSTQTRHQHGCTNHH